MHTQEARARRWFVWSVALEGVFGAIIVALVFVALGLLHPALTLPLIGIVMAPWPGWLSSALATTLPLKPRTLRPTSATPNSVTRPSAFTGLRAV
jgi:hypothetical protein